MRRAARLCAFVFLWVPAACRPTEPPPLPPLATVQVVEGGCEAKLKADGYRLNVDACVEVESGSGREIFVVYRRYHISDDDHLKRHLVVAAGPAVATEAQTTADLWPVQVISTTGSWDGTYFTVTIRRNGEVRVLAFFPRGQPDIFGELVALKSEVPAEAKALVPKEGQIGYYGTVSGHTFLIYSTPLPPPEPPQDDFEAMVRRLYPTINKKMHVLFGPDASHLAEEKVLRTYSYNHGRNIYLETEKGAFLFSPALERPLFGKFLDRYYPKPLERD